MTEQKNYIFQNCGYNKNHNIFNQGKPVRKCCYQRVPRATKTDRNEIKIKILKKITIYVVKDTNYIQLLKILRILKIKIKKLITEKVLKHGFKN